MLVFGGETYENVVAALPLSGSPSWYLLNPTGTPPSGRWQHSAIYDPVRHRMVMFGGYEYANAFQNEVWALSLGSQPAWLHIAPTGTPPSPRLQHTAVYDSQRDRMLVIAGEDQRPRDDVWSLVFPDLTPVQEDDRSAGPQTEFLPPSPNPTSGTTQLTLNLERAGRVVLDVFDTHGRRVRRISDSWLEAGRHRVQWSGDGDDGRRLAVGVYFVAMRAPGVMKATRIAFIQ